MSEQKFQVSAKKILSLLDEGYVRLTKQEAEEGSGKSIQSWLKEQSNGAIKTAADVKAIFEHPQLKGKKTKGYTRKMTGSKKEAAFVLIDDVEPEVVTNAEAEVVASVSSTMTADSFL
jgi:hypothetical protein